MIEVGQRQIKQQSNDKGATIKGSDPSRSAEGVQIDRGSLGLPGRACLVCSRAAVECIRAKRHSFNEVIGNVDALLAHFRA